MWNTQQRRDSPSADAAGVYSNFTFCAVRGEIRVGQVVNKPAGFHNFGGKKEIAE